MKNCSWKDLLLLNSCKVDWHTHPRPFLTILQFLILFSNLLTTLGHCTPSPMFQTRLTSMVPSTKFIMSTLCQVDYDIKVQHAILWFFATLTLLIYRRIYSTGVTPNENYDPGALCQSWGYSYGCKNLKRPPNTWWSAITFFIFSIGFHDFGVKS